MNPAVSLVLLLNSPSAQMMQSKQHIGLPLTKARRVPGRQLSLQTDLGTYVPGTKKTQNKNFTKLNRGVQYKIHNKNDCIKIS